MTTPQMLLNILVLDDDVGTRNLIKLKLKTAAENLGINITIIEAVNADEAWKIWREQHIHGIVSDMFLNAPINGLQFMKEIRRDMPEANIPAIIVSGVIDSFNVSNLWGVAQVIPKPIDDYFIYRCYWWLDSIEPFWINYARNFPEGSRKLFITIKDNNETGL